MHGQCDARFTFSTVKHSCSVSATKLYCSVTEAHVLQRLIQDHTDSTVVEIPTRDLSITSLIPKPLGCLATGKRDRHSGENIRRGKHRGAFCHDFLVDLFTYFCFTFGSCALDTCSDYNHHHTILTNFCCHRRRYPPGSDFTTFRPTDVHHIIIIITLIIIIIFLAHEHKAVGTKY